MRADSDAEVCVMPVADGGEGTVEALVSGLNGSVRELTVLDPLGREISAEYGIVGDTAVIEAAAAAGISLISDDELNPMNTTTYGVGEMIKDAALSGCRNFIIGIGGSATNDGGIGMLQALGYKFLDKNGKSVPFGAKALNAIADIKIENALSVLNECSFNIACDVTNPLCGKNGCSFIFAPQKGASAEDIPIMDKGMGHYADLTRKLCECVDPEFPGAGAAGGLGFAFMAYLGGTLRSGIDLVLEMTGIDECIRNSDIVVTGEGKIDAQTSMGKAPAGVARIAKKHGKPVIAFAGSVASGAESCNKCGIDAFFPIIKGPCSLSDAMKRENALKNLEDTAEQVFRLLAVRLSEN